MRKWVLLLLMAALGRLDAPGQDVITPDSLYGQLFRDVQLARIFPDSKTFVDCVPKREPADILRDYEAARSNPAVRFSLKLFVEENFEQPKTPQLNYITQEKDVVMHIKNLWGVLKRQQDQPVRGSTLLPLPNPYIVPGGRFREVYYWDSYFTMLGLKESGETEMIENMVNNFAYLLSRYGHIPNGNRSYYLSRSQPPFFALMLDLLASFKGDYVYATFLPALNNEYNYWMDQSAPTRHVVRMPDGSILNRYYDRDAIPRQEAYAEDYELAEKSKTDKAALLRNLRSAAESGWDFSSRWFADGKTLGTIQVTSLVPVDLNCLLYHLEKVMAKAYRVSGNLLKAKYYDNIAERRRRAIDKYCWSAASGWYVDYNLVKKAPSPELTLAGMSPFFLNVAPASRIGPAAAVLEKKFLRDGGLVTTLKNTGQQWDAPNGWAPLEWMAIAGLENYGRSPLAREIAQRWVKLNIRVFENTGKLMEKYNVVDTRLEAGGGEYPSQDGFGWTNGVLLACMKKYDLKQEPPATTPGP
ncbi:MAG TPA: alpha,alpha-trehalase TreA [Chitinophagaceae bacterium]|nr:alpha,alpha-trehalase TreA [Chitinophagaceae bacterium]